jgi:Arylsulfotransferase (ASST)
MEWSESERGSAASSRRDFLRLIGAGAAAAAGLALTGCGSSKVAAAARELQARSGETIKHGIQRFRSRPDLLPPDIIIDVRAKDVAEGVVLTDCHGGPAQQGPLILDQTGRMVWFLPLSDRPSPAHRAFNVRVQSYRGEPVLSWFEGAVVSGHGQGHYAIFDGRYQQIAQVHAGNGYQGDLHEFLLTDSGTALFTCYGRATGSLPAAGGARRGPYFYGVVQEVDVATGKVLFQWRSDEHVGFDASYEAIPGDARDTWDYFHVNAISLDPTDGNLVISSRNTWACYKVSRTTGKVIWKLGGKDSDFKMGPNTHFAFQHDVTLQAGGVLTMFDNEAGPPNEASQSRGLVLAIDEDSRQARFLSQYHHHPPVLSQALGSLQELSDGHVFMGWGDSSYFTEYDRSGGVLFDGHLASGTLSYRAFRENWIGSPATAPDLAIVRSGSTARLYVSWNGATEVERWSVLGGHHPNSLSQLGVAAVAGFETEIAVPAAPPYLAVAALDQSGATLGSSGTKRV